MWRDARDRHRVLLTILNKPAILSGFWYRSYSACSLLARTHSAYNSCLCCFRCLNRKFLTIKAERQHHDAALGGSQPGVKKWQTQAQMPWWRLQTRSSAMQITQARSIFTWLMVGRILGIGQVNLHLYQWIYLYRVFNLAQNMSCDQVLSLAMSHDGTNLLLKLESFPGKL